MECMCALGRIRLSWICKALVRDDEGALFFFFLRQEDFIFF